MNVNERYARDYKALQDALTDEWQTTRAIAEKAGVQVPRALDLLRTIQVQGGAVRRNWSSSYHWMKGPSA